MRLLSDAFLCLSCSSIFLTCYLAYKPQGNRLSQSKFVQCLAEHGSLISQSICFIYHLNIGGFAFCAAFLLFPGLQQQHKPMQTEGQLSATAEGILKENSSEHPAIAISIQAMGDHSVCYLHTLQLNVVVNAVKNLHTVCSGVHYFHHW